MEKSNQVAMINKFLGTDEVGTLLRDIEIISRQDNKTLARWACELNSWKWPEEIPDPERADIPFDEMYRRRALLDLIKSRVGKKLILRKHWEINRLDMSEFEEFWRVHYESKDPQEIEAYHQRRRDQIIERERNRTSLTGHTKEYYKKLHAEKEKELGMKLLGSMGYMKRELLSSVEWVNVFDELETFPDLDTIVDSIKRKGFEIAQTEFDGEEFRVWIFA